MLRTRSHAVMALAAGVLALSACTSGTEGGSTGTQNKNASSASTSTQQKPTAAPTAPTAVVMSSPPGSGNMKALEDVKLGVLSVDMKGARSAEVAITNHTPKKSNYIIDLQLMSADGKTELDTAMVSAAGVAAGKTTKVKAQFALTEKLPKGATITIVGIARLADG